MCGLINDRRGKTGTRLPRLEPLCIKAITRKITQFQEAESASELDGGDTDDVDGLDL
jgi:hypothetical protein